MLLWPHGHAIDRRLVEVVGLEPERLTLGRVARHVERAEHPCVDDSTLSLHLRDEVVANSICDGARWFALIVETKLAKLHRLCPDERIGMAACVPVLLIIGYWLMVRRAAAAGEHDEPVGADAVLAVPVPQMVDTERGRMS